MVNYLNDFNLPAYTNGIIEFEIEKVIQNCLPLALGDLLRKPINIYPNPSSKIIAFDLPQDLQLIDTRLQITNSIGQNVFVGQLEHHHFEMDIQALSEGVYFIAIDGNSKNAFGGSFVKQ